MSEDNNLVCIEEMAQNCYVCWPFFPRITREKDKCIHIRYVEFLYNGMVLQTGQYGTVLLCSTQLVMIGLLNNSKNKWQILCFRKIKMEKKRRYEVWDIGESISGSDPSLLTATRQFSPRSPHLLLIWPETRDHTFLHFFYPLFSFVLQPCQLKNILFHEETYKESVHLKCPWVLSLSFLQVLRLKSPPGFRESAVIVHL